MNKKYLVGLILLALIIVIAGALYFVFNKYFYYQNGKILKISDTLEQITFDDARKSGNMDEAVIIAEKRALDNEVQSLVDLAQVYVNKGSHDNEEAKYAPLALEIANKILLKDANNFEGYRVKGYALEIMDKFDEAIVAYNKALEIEPNNAFAYNSRGHAYELMGDYQKAFEDYEKGYSIDQNNVGILVNLSRIYLAKLDFEKAREFAQKVIDYKGDDLLFYNKATAYTVLAQYERFKENKEGAISNFSEAIAVLPTFVEGYLGRAEIRLFYSENIVENEKELITKDLNAAIFLNSNSSKAYYLFGVFYEKQELYESSLLNYEKALAVLDSDLNFGPEMSKYLDSMYKEKIDFISKKFNKTN